MKYSIAALILSICTVHVNMMASTKVFNHTTYPIKVSLHGAFLSHEPFEVQAGAMVETLKGIESCVIITHVQIWVKEGNMDDYAQQPTIDKQVFLDRCFKQIHVISTPNEQGEYVYDITTSHE